MNPADIAEVLWKVGLLFAGIVAFVVVTRYTVKDLSANYKVLEGKIDAIIATLTTIQVNAGRHDARAQSIQESVGQIQARVGRLEGAQMHLGHINGEDRAL
jgi:hypothetical protein